MSLLSALLDLIFPAKCPFCGRVLDRPGICDTCRGELPWTEGADALRRGPGGFLCAAPLWYQGLAREGLHRFNFRGMSSACRLWETKPLPLLRKTVHNPAQSGLKEAAARRANVLGVYEAVDPERISGHRILLVDDICTTGATLAECARVLREAGAEDVVCAAAALTPLERDSGKKA